MSDCQVLIQRCALPIMACLLGAVASRADTVLIDFTFDNTANDTGTAQQVSNGLTGTTATVATGVIETGSETATTSGTTGDGLGSSGFNFTSSVDVTTADPSAIGFSVTWDVASITLNSDISDISELAFNGLFFGVVSGTDANGTAGSSLYANNPHAFGYVAGSGPIPNNGYGDNVMRQDAEGAAPNNGNSVNTSLSALSDANAFYESFEDGFTVTLSLFNDDTWTLTSTGLSENLNESGSLKTTGTGIFAYASIAADATPYVSLQGEDNSSMIVNRVTLTTIEPPVSAGLKILSVTKVDDTVTVQFQGADGETYDLNKSTTLDFSTLSSQDSIFLDGTDTGELQDSSATEDAAFYRVEQQ